MGGWLKGEIHPGGKRDKKSVTSPTRIGIILVEGKKRKEKSHGNCTKKLV